MSNLRSAESLEADSTPIQASTLGNPPRHSFTVRITHWIVTLCFFTLLVSGIEVTISHPRFYWGETGTVLTEPIFRLPIPASRRLVPSGYGYVLPDQNGWSRSLHFQAAWFLVFTGLVYVVTGFFSRHFPKNLIPQRRDLSWREASRVIAKHLRFVPSHDEEAWSYNVLQKIAYLFVVFALFPLVIWTGLAMSPAFNSALPATVNLLGGRQSARTIHFLVSLVLLLFVVLHVMLVWRTGFASRMRAMITGKRLRRRRVQMINTSRRKLLVTGIAATAGLSGLGVAARLAEKYGLIPPDHGGVYGLGETLTYGSLRLLTRHSLAREFSRSEISQRPLANEVATPSEDFKRFQAAKFVDWRLAVDGMVERPTQFTVDQLKSYPSRSQITEVACEEGWSYIAEWNGVPLSYILNLVGAHRQAKYVFYFSIEPDWWESMDMADALHPQTLVTYGMNGDDLSVGFGGPVRMRLPRQLGYKSVKFINRIVVTDDVKKFGKGLGSVSPETGYAWYAGI